MAAKTTNFQSLAVKILEALGNSDPKCHHIELAEALFLKTSIQYKLAFDKRLSAGEIECLVLAAAGRTIKQTAQLLSVKNSTVMTLRKRILSKLGCSSMAQAVFVGIQYGYLSPEDPRVIFNLNKHLSST